LEPIICGLFETEEKFEWFCIQTIEGGMSDREAIKAFGTGQLKLTAIVTDSTMQKNTPVKNDYKQIL